MTGINKVDPKISIEVDKPRTLLLNFSAMRMFEKQTGKSIFRAMVDPSASDYGILAWVCLLHEDETLTLEKVAGLIDTYGLEYFMDKLTEATKAAFPETTGKLKNAMSPPGGTG